MLDISLDVLFPDSPYDYLFDSERFNGKKINPINQ